MLAEILDMLLRTDRLPHPVILVREVKLEFQVEKPLVGRGHPGDDFTDLPDSLLFASGTWYTTFVRKVYILVVRF